MQIRRRLMLRAVRELLLTWLLLYGASAADGQVSSTSSSSPPAAAVNDATTVSTVDRSTDIVKSLEEWLDDYYEYDYYDNDTTASSATATIKSTNSTTITTTSSTANESTVTPETTIQSLDNSNYYNNTYGNDNETTATSPTTTGRPIHVLIHIMTQTSVLSRIYTRYNHVARYKYPGRATCIRIQVDTCRRDNNILSLIGYKIHVDGDRRYTWIQVDTTCIRAT